MEEVQEARAVSKFNRISSRKARLVADQIRGKNVVEGFKILQGINDKNKVFIEKTVKSAVANYKNRFSQNDESKLYIKSLFIDEGPDLKRFKPRAKGMAYKILKPTSHITVSISSK